MAQIGIDKSDTKKNGDIHEGTTQPKKPKRRDKSDLGEHFVAPDGGWGWLVCVAAGISNMAIFPMVLQFGLIFREKFELIHFSSSEISTIFNAQGAVSACTGLLNGPLFRRYTFRQVALVSSLLVFVGIFCTAFAHTFATFILFYSIIFGLGMGFSISASSLAVNTYFKVNRRKAMGFSWTITGMGPIVLPHLITCLIAYYGIQGTVLIFAAHTLHSFVCGLLYQPVSWHKRDCPDDEKGCQESEHICKFCEASKQRTTGLFSSQYLYKNDDSDNPGFEITDPGTPMMARANDGWYGSKLSLASIKQTARLRTISSSKDIEAGRRLAELISQEELPRPFLKPNHFNLEREGFKKSWSYALRLDHIAHSCTCAEERDLLERKKTETLLLEERLAEEAARNMSFGQKVVTFFDLGLLKDFTFVNLLVGLTVINFGEINFTVLAPFILHQYGLTDMQISAALSLLAATDMTMRFLVPFIFAKIKWDNRVLYSISVFGLVVGRTMIASTDSYSLILAACAWTGLSKGVRTIFWPLLIPSYVPLKRLPAASGLALLLSGIFTLSCGPFVGVIQDQYSHIGALHFLDIMTMIALLMWLIEALVVIHRRRRKIIECVQN